MPLTPINPAPPSASRAVVVGLERYGVGNLRGPVAEALLVAQALKDAGVHPDRIDLWLAPTDQSTFDSACKAWPRCRAFDIGDFRNYLLGDLADDAAGGTLYVHWCGHGVARGKEHHLLLPGSSAVQLESVELDDLARHLVDDRHRAFRHLVLVVDTCRESLQAWNTNALASQTLLAQGRANGPVYCKLFVCAEGQTTTYTQAGSSQGVLLRKLLADAPADSWPEFKQALQAAASRLAASAYVFATDWNDQETYRSTEPALDQVFGCAKVAFDRQAELAVLSLRPEMPRRVLADPAGLLAFLQDLPATQGVAPLHEFALRLLSEPGVGEAKALREWVKAVVSDTEQASIDTRMNTSQPGNVLLLWVAADPDAPTEPAWRVMAARCNAEGVPVPDGRDHHTARHARGLPALKTLLAGLLDELSASSNETVELFLPRGLLAEGLELQELACGGEKDPAFDLSGTYVTLLRNPRELSQLRQLWHDRAPNLLARWHSAQPLSHPPSPNELRPADVYLQANGPLWCLVPDAMSDAQALQQAHQLCTKHGLPALAWARGAPPAPALQKTLDEGLRSPAAQAAARLLELRRAGLQQLSLMLDDPTRPPPWGVQTT